MTIRLLPVSSISATSDALQAHRFLDVLRNKPQPAKCEVIEEVPRALTPVPSTLNVDLLLNQWRVERVERARDVFLSQAKEENNG
jgi:hypothetical protein